MNTQGAHFWQKIFGHGHQPEPQPQQPRTWGNGPDLRQQDTGETVPIEYPLKQPERPREPVRRTGDLMRAWAQMHPKHPTPTQQQDTGAMVRPVLRTTRLVRPEWVDAVVNGATHEDEKPASPDWLTAEVPGSDPFKVRRQTQPPAQEQPVEPLDLDDTVEARAILKLKHSEKGH